MPVNYTPGFVNQQNLYEAPVSNLGITPPATNWGADIASAGGMLSSASNMGVGGMVGMGIGAATGTGPMGMVVGGTIGGIVDKGIALWQGNKASAAQKKYLQQRQALNDRLAEADRIESAKQFQMNFGQTQQQIDFNQANTAAQFRQTTWQNSLNNLQNKANSDMNLRLTMMKAGMI